MVAVALPLSACSGEPSSTRTTTRVASTASTPAPTTPTGDRTTIAPLASPTKVFDGSPRDWVSQNVSCVRDKGFPVEDPLPGDYSWRAPQGADGVSYSWAVYDCMMQIGNIPLPPMSDHNLRIMFDTELRVADCLKGFGVPVKDPPTFERFAESRRTMEGDIWIAKSELRETDPRYAEITEKCDPVILQTAPYEQ